jgi:hypothetical protein
MRRGYRLHRQQTGDPLLGLDLCHQEGPQLRIDAPLGGGELTIEGGRLTFRIRNGHVGHVRRHRDARV